MSESIVDFDYTYIPFISNTIGEKGLDIVDKGIPLLYYTEVY